MYADLLAEGSVSSQQSIRSPGLRSAWRKLLRPVLLTLGLLLALGAASLLKPAASGEIQASVYYVDAVHGSDQTGDGSPTHPWQTVTHALGQVDGPDVEIHVAPGVYDEALGEAFPIVMESDVSLIGADRSTTVLQGNGSDYVVHFPNTSIFTETTVLSGFKIANGSNGVRVDGRGADYPSPVVEDNWITGNTHGIHNRATDTKRVYTVIRGNLISENNGQGIYNYANYRSHANPIIKDNQIVDNGSNGIYCYAKSLNDRWCYCSPEIMYNLISGNQGSGIYCKTGLDSSCDPNIVGNTISNNQDWGWRHKENYKTCQPKFVNNFVFGNGSGGALFAWIDRPTFVNNTVAYNNNYGLRYGKPTVINSIVWGHNDDLTVSVNRVRFSDISESGYEGINNNISVDPQFVDPTHDDYHVLPTSPVHDAGDSAHPDLPPTDLDGDPRILGEDVDIGADETFSYTVAIVKSVWPANVTYPGDLLTYTLTLSNLGPIVAGGPLVTDTLPADTTWAGYARSSVGYATVSNDVLTWTGTLPVTGAQTITYLVTLDPLLPLETLITNTASIDDRTGGITETAPITVIIGPKALWRSSRQMVDQVYANPGQLLRYTLTISNEGNILANDVVVTDTLDDHVDLGWASEGGVFNDGKVVWSGLTITDGSRITLALEVKINAPLTDATRIVNQAQVAGGGRPPFNLPTDGAATWIYNPIQVGFGATPTLGLLPLTVAFSNTSTGGITYYLWSFGDGATSPITEPTHVYDEHGYYTVALTAGNPFTSTTLARPVYVKACAIPVADFVATPDMGLVPLVVTYTNLSQYADTYLWDYGDGLTSTVGAPVHAHTYTATGFYTVGLRAANAFTFTQETRSRYIAVYISTTLYVDAINGSDQWGDGSPAAPWRTLSHALSQVDSPGLTIRVAPGVYDEALGESFPITMKPGVSLIGADRITTILSGNGSDYVIHFPDTSVFTESTVISGFKITNGSEGVRVDGRRNDYPSPVVENNWITRNTYGIYNRATGTRRIYTVIRGNLVSENSAQGIYNYVGYKSHVNPIIKDSQIVGNGSNGIHCYVTSSAGHKSYCSPDIAGNLVSDNLGQGIFCKTGHFSACNPNVVGNVISNNQGWGWKRSHSGTYHSNQPRFVNNFVFGNGSGGAQFYPADSPILVNNTVVYNHTYGIRDGSSTIVNSIIWGHEDDLNVSVNRVSFSDVSEGGYAGVNDNISAAPNFVDLAHDDYHVLPTSPVRDAGDSTYPDLPFVDFDGDPRISGTTVDIGADETITYNLAMAKSVWPIDAYPGDVLTFTLTLTNLGLASAGGPLVTDVLPVDTTWVDYAQSSVGYVSVKNGVLTWTGTLAVTGSEKITCRVQANPMVPAGTLITNTALVANRTGGITETAPVTVTVKAAPSWIWSHQAVVPTCTNPGQRLVYSLTVSNLGNLAATDVTVTDTLDSHVTFDQASPGGTFDGERVVWDGLDVSVGSYVTLTLAVTVNAPLSDAIPIVNRARVVGGGRVFDLPTDQATTWVYNSVQAGFSATPRLGPVPLAVTLSDKAQHATDYLWSYGDGLTSTIPTTHVHTYQGAGFYTLTLHVANPTGSDALTRTRYVTTYHAVVADFKGEPRAGFEPLTVEFVNRSQYADQFLWNYGDGITSTTGAVTHTHVYTNPGFYDVSLRAMATYDSDVYTQSAYVAVYDRLGDLTVCMEGPPVCGFDNLQDAVDAADPGDLIKVAGGIYTHTWSRATPPSYDGPNDVVQAAYISQSVVIRGGYTTTDDFADPPDPVANPTVLDAQGQGRLLFIAGNVSPLVEGLRLTGGDAAGLGGGAGGSNAGGGAYVLTATASLSASHVSENLASGGAGVYVRNSASAFQANTIEANEGGIGVGVLAYNSDVTFIDNLVDANLGALGVGLWVENGHATLVDNTISHNEWAQSGGGVYLKKSTAALNGNLISANAGSEGVGVYMLDSQATFEANVISANLGWEGGGVYMLDSQATFDKNVIDANGVFWGSVGGGVYIESSQATFDDNRIVYNLTGGDYEQGGGGLYAAYSTITLTHNTISSNTVSYETGGGVQLDQSNAWLTENTIRANTAEYGGGLYVLGGDLTCHNNVIVSNTADASGGALLSDTDANLSANLIAGNTARYRGGLELYRGTVTLEGNTVRDNVSTHGYCGGVCLYYGDFILVNNLVVDNQSDDWGSGLDIRGASPRLLHNTIAGNTGGDGSGVHVDDGTAILTNTILVSHQVGLYVTGDASAVLDATLWGNQIDWAGAGTIITGTHNDWGDPLFLNPAAHDYHVDPGSPARDAGLDAGIITDVDGEPRPVGLGYDIGADETTSYSLTIAKSVWPGGTVYSGDRLTYSLTLSKQGPAGAGDLRLVDHLPGGTTWAGYLQASVGQAEVSSDTLTWRGNLITNQPQTIAYDAQVAPYLPAGSLITNTANLIDRLGNVIESGPVSLTVGLGASWAWSRQVVDQSYAHPGDPLVYTLTVSNRGNAPASDLTVTDTLDGDVSFAQASPGGAFDGQRVVWDNLSLAVGDQVTLTVAVTVNAPLSDATPIVNQVRVTGGGGEPFDLPTDAATTLVYNPIQADFSATPTLGPVPLDVTFEDQSQHATGYLWSYGDGLTSTVPGSHVHTYPQVGVYTASLRVTNPLGADVLTHTGYITTYHSALADFAAWQRDDLWPPTMVFTNQSQYADRFLWEYGDGTSSTITATAHPHTYPTAGLYDVALTARGPYNQHTTTQTLAVACLTPTAQFTGTPRIGFAPLTVDFSSRQQFAEGFVWQLGDGYTSTAQSFSHTFTQPGHYTVDLALTNTCSQRVVSRPAYVSVYTSSPASVYFVDVQNGSDLSGDGSQAAPWRTVSYARKQVSGPDAEIRVASGQYDESTGESFPIAMKRGVSLRGAGYEATILRGDGQNPVVLFPEAHFAQATFISGFKITNGTRGIKIEGEAGSGTAPTIQENWITGNKNIGIHTRAGDSENIYSIIRDNLISNNGTHGIYGYVARDARVDLSVQNNHITHNQGWGVWYTNPGYPVTTYPQFSNNVIADNADGGARFGAGASPTFINDTVAFNNAYGLVEGTLTIVNSIIWGHADDTDAPIDQVSFSDIGEAGYAGHHNNISADPQFLNPAQGDYHIPSNSPVVNAGYNSVPGLPDTDIDGEPRIMGSTVDMGADEVPLYLCLFKEVEPDPAYVGQPLTYTLRATNYGDQDLSTIITDVLPAQVSPSGTLTWTPTISGSGGMWTQQVQVTAGLDYLGPLTNSLWARVEGATRVAYVLTSDVTDVPISGLVATSDSPTLLGQATTLSASVGYGTHVSYTWALGDGTLGQGATLSHTYPAVGRFTAVVTASNSAGSLTAATDVIVARPITGLMASNNSPTLLGQATILSASVATGTPVSYTWALGDGSLGLGTRLSHTYPAVGVYTAVVTANNPINTLSATTSITVVEAPITGLIASNDSPTPLGQATTLSASVVSGTNVSYTWALGDGSLGQGAMLTHTYLALGAYTAVVTASNSLGALSATTAVTVTDAPLTGLTASNDSPTPLGQATSLSASLASGTHVSYAWVLGDGALGQGQTLTHIYPALGAYTAVVTASNSLGAFNATTAVTVTDVPLTGLAASNDSPTPLGQATTLSASLASGTNVSYSWALGDGALGQGATLPHTYPAAGVYTAVVTASNPVSVMTATTIVSVTETEVPITGLTASNDSPTPLGQATTLSASLASGSHVSYAWALGDGALQSGPVVAHTYPALGVYTALVTASNPVSVMTATTPVTVTEVFSDTPITGLVASSDSPTPLGQATILSASLASGSRVVFGWTFGDGTFGAGQWVSHTYPAVGLYTAVVVASNPVSQLSATVPVSVVQPPAEPGLSLVKSVWAAGGPSEVPPGAELTYTLSLSNAGSGPATGVVLTDVLPLGLDFGGWIEPGGADLSGRTITWGPGDVPPGMGHSLAFTVTLETDPGWHGQAITNTAVFSSANAGSGWDQAVITVVGRHWLYLPIVYKQE